MSKAAESQFWIIVGALYEIRALLWRVGHTVEHISTVKSKI